MVRQSATRVAYGDFQTPRSLASECCRFLSALGVKPQSVFEPTCGKGSFLNEALVRFGNGVTQAVGYDINPDYVACARALVTSSGYAAPLTVARADFFSLALGDVIESLPEPILVVGNPPWVTNSTLGSIGSANLPAKSNFLNHSGWDAISGKSNFDISEWMIRHLLIALNGRRGWLAMLCKTAVARKVLAQAWQSDLGIKSARAAPIDAAAHFGAAVDACLLVCEFVPGERSSECSIYDDLNPTESSRSFGLRDGHLVADIESYANWRRLSGNVTGAWRSGIKHDASKIMELQPLGDSLLSNGLGEVITLEDEFVFPLLKSSDLANGRTKTARARMLVPQRSTSDDTSALKQVAPQTWRYLTAHRNVLNARTSSIYRKRPDFAIFGIGPYTFAPWKVAISGMYKELVFRVVGPIDGKPVVFDDTVNFLSFNTEEQATDMLSALNSRAAQEFLNAITFWDAKRPITIDILRRLDLGALGREVGLTLEWGSQEYASQSARFVARRSDSQPTLL